MEKSDRLDMRIRPDLKADLKRLAERDRRRLTDYVEIVLTDHVAAAKKREGRK